LSCAIDISSDDIKRTEGTEVKALVVHESLISIHLNVMAKIEVLANLLKLYKPLQEQNIQN
jgi:hypothetical protein